MTKTEYRHIVPNEGPPFHGYRNRSFDQSAYDAITFASAEEYLGSESVHESECVITDLQMPGMTGIDLQDKLIADGYCKPIILMSALSEEEAGNRAIETAAFGFLRKPFSDQRLIECLDGALRRG